MIKISENTKAALARKKAAGTVLGRAAVPAATVARIQQLRAQGKSVRTITAELQAAGVQIGKSAVGKYC